MHGGAAAPDDRSRLLAALPVVRNRGRRPFVRQVLRDIADGAQSLGELDFAAMCRRHGVPAPDRQVLRRTALGRVYLDARWEGSRLVVEIDGAGHRVGLAVTDDNLRQNEVSLGHDRVLRIDLVGLRVHEAAFMGQVRREASPDTRTWVKIVALTVVFTHVRGDARRHQKPRRSPPIRTMNAPTTTMKTTRTNRLPRDTAVRAPT